MDKIIEIFNSARKYMRANNNYYQWNGEYPGRSDILKDIDEKVSYVGETHEGELVMTFAFIVGEDETYKVIKEGEWLNNAPYGTIHRIASDGRIKGVLSEACEFCFKRVKNIRIDTHKNNQPMLKALKNLDFVRCGVINCRDGSPREAFQKSIK